MSILSFYSVIEKYRDFDFESYFNSVTDDDIRRSIHERNLTHEDLLNLLSPKAANHLEEMAEKVVSSVFSILVEQCFYIHQCIFQIIV